MGGGEHILLCPLRSSGGHLIGGLLFIRGAVWLDAEMTLMERLADAYAHAWQALLPDKGPLRHRLLALWEKRWLRIAAAAFLFLLMWLPVRLSVLAPAVVVPVDPIIVSAPIDGVVDRFHVEPNQQVKSDQLLFSMDDTLLRNRHAITIKSLAVARAGLRRAKQKAFSDPKSKAEVALLKARLEQADAEVTYTSELLTRIAVHSPASGIAVFEDPNDWLGKPVVVGEKVLTIADPSTSEVEIRLPVADAISLERGAEVKLFLNIDPTQALSAHIRQTSYEARITQNNILAFRLKAAFQGDIISPRIGLQGTAKVYGEQVTLIYYLLRRPLSAMRQWLGM